MSVEGAASLKQDVPTKGGQGWGQDAVWEINEGALAPLNMQGLFKTNPSSIISGIFFPLLYQ